MILIQINDNLNDEETVVGTAIFKKIRYKYDFAPFGEILLQSITISDTHYYYYSA